MKFGRDYLETLEREGFPSEWVHSAISYRQLKKCIKKLRKELLVLGLSPEVLNQLCQAEGADEEIVVVENDISIAGFQYSFRKYPDSSFAPKLTLLLDPKNRTPIDAFLSPETRQYLHKLSFLPSLALDTESYEVPDAQDAPSSHDEPSTSLEKHGSNIQVQAVEVPLTSDTEFFYLLRQSLLAIHDLQERQEKELDCQVRVLRETIVKVSNSSFRWTEHSREIWREIFRQYIELQIFFSTDEAHSGQRTSAGAQQRLEQFQTALSKDNKVRRLRRDGRMALENFLHINAVLLQNLKFQEVNRVAFSKILKKFDKQTALRARDSLPRFAETEAFLSQDVARVICQTISEDVLSVIPQLSDYLCPICLSVAFKPIRLKCNHVFCVRCLVVMQRRQQNLCPLCRGDVVMEATSNNLDQDLLNFLSQTFPKETKAKQKENERAAFLDLYGETYETCVVM